MLYLLEGRTLDDGSYLALKRNDVEPYENKDGTIVEGGDTQLLITFRAGWWYGCTPCEASLYFTNDQFRSLYHAITDKDTFDRVNALLIEGVEDENDSGKIADLLEQLAEQP